LNHPAQRHVAEVLVMRASERRRGSGYLVAPGWVLTAAHVVAGAEAAAVWLGAPPAMDPASGSGVDPRRIMSCEGADLALIPVGPPDAQVDRALFGQVERTGPDPVPAAAAGCPRFKLRPDPVRPGIELRELTLVGGTIAAMSDAKAATLELALQIIPADDPEPDKHSPWEGMSGAAVWVSGRLVGVIGQHHPRQGNGVLTVRPLTGLFAALPADDLDAWQQALPQLGAGPGDLPPAASPPARELVVRRAQRDAGRLAPGVLIARDEDLARLAAFVRSPERWRWVQGPPFAGKTALLAWFALHPPEGIDVAACFLRRTTGQANADYAVDVLTRQLAHIAQRPDYRSAPHLVQQVGDFTDYLEDAAAACRQQGRRLLVLVDGLDEDQTVEPGLAVARWLPDAETLPENAWLLVASRDGVHVPLPDGHPLGASTQLLTPSLAASEIEGLARDELAGTRRTGGLIYDLLGLLCAAFGGLTVTDITELLQSYRRAAISSVEIMDTLEGSLARSVSVVADAAEPQEPVWAFGHDALLDHARSLYARDLPRYYALLASWALEYRQRGWPPATPQYLLRPYTGQLTSQALDPASTPEQRRQASETLYQIVANPARRARLLQQTSNPAIPDQEITEAQRVLVAARDRGNTKAEAELTYRLAILALARRPLGGTFDDVIALVAFVWAQAGRSRDAIAIAASIETPSQRARALADVDGILVGNPRTSSPVHPVGQVSDVPRPRLREQELGAAAVSMARDGHGDLAVRVADGIQDLGQRVLAQAEVAVSLARAGYGDLVGHIAFGTEDPDQREQALRELAVSLVTAGYGDHARQIASSLKDPWQRALAQVEGAVSVARAGFSGHASQEPSGIRGRVEHGWAQGAVILARDGHSDQAAAIANRIRDSGARMQPQADDLAVAAVALARSGRGDQAIHIADGIQDFGQRVLQQAEVAISLAQAGYSGRARQLASGIENPGQRGRALCMIAVSLARDGHSDQAIDIAGTIQHRRIRSIARARLAGILADAQLADQAVSDAIGVLDFGQQRLTLAEIAGILAWSGLSDHAKRAVAAIEYPQDRERAQATAGHIKVFDGQKDHASTGATGIEDHGPQPWALAEAVHVTAFDRERDRATGATVVSHPAGSAAKGLAEATAILAGGGLVEEAVSIASRIADTGLRARALADVAGNLARAGQLAQAISIGFGIDVPGPRTQALAHIAGSLSPAQARDADGIASQAEQTAAAIEDPAARARALAKVAVSLADAGHPERAADLAALAAQICASFQDPEAWPKALAEMASRLIKAGKDDPGINLADRAIGVAASIKDHAIQKRAEAIVAAILAPAGDSYQTNRADVTEILVPAREMAVSGPGQRPAASGKERRKKALRLASEAKADEAISVAIGITNPEMQTQVLAEVAAILSQAGLTAQALYAATRIATPRARARALRKWGGFLAYVGQDARAARGLLFNGEINVPDPEIAADRLAQRGTSRPKDQGKLANLLAMAERADEAINAAAAVANSAKRAEALAEVAGVLIQVGQPGQAVSAAAHIENLRQRTRVLAMIALSVEGEDDNVFIDAICEVMLSPYARENMAALPVPVIERLAAEGRLE